ncbi:MAG: hypothetical protein Q7V17_08445 [Afipia sp.]|nr:hypothetical protein [Afipia sp.]
MSDLLGSKFVRDAYRGRLCSVVSRGARVGAESPGLMPLVCFLLEGRRLRKILVQAITDAVRPTLCLTVPFGIGRRSLFFVTLDENASCEANRRNRLGPSSISR